MRRFSQRNSLVTLSDINITPLLDLAFVLLIIFVITTPLLEKGLSVQLPSGVGLPDKAPLQRKDIRIVEVSNTGYYRLENRKMELPQIIQQLIKDNKANPNMVIYIRADENGKYKLVADILVACQLAGLNRVSLATDPPAKTMNRLQKKCFIVSASLHGLLFVVLLFGSALSWHREKPLPPTLSLIRVPPNLLTDAQTTGGDPTPQAAPAPPPPAAAAVQPPPVSAPPKPVVPPKPPVPAVRELPVVPKPVTPVVKPVVTPAPVVVKPAPKVVTPPKPTLTAEEIAALQKPTVRSTKDAAQAAKAAEDAAAAKKYAEKLKLIANAFGKSLTNLSKGPAPSVDIKPFNEHGDGGPMVANYRDVVGSKYKGAWTPPPTLTDEFATTTASITIDRDGRVKSARITKGSGNAGMDRSVVQTTLDNVTFIAPFPSDSKDQERTYDIQFNLKAKLSAG